jgi:putative transposase
MGRVKRDRQDTDTVLAYFSKSKKRAIETYEDFIKQGIDAGSRPKLVGGGLIRSCGGWS